MSSPSTVNANTTVFATDRLTSVYVSVARIDLREWRIPALTDFGVCLQVDPRTGLVVVILGYMASGRGL